MKPRQAFRRVWDELHRAQAVNPPYNTAHEGHSVIREEFDELWDLVKSNKYPHGPATPEMEFEAVQIAATAIRFLVDLCPADEDENRDIAPFP